MQNTSEPGKLQYKRYITLGPRNTLVSDESVHTQISALYTGVPDESGSSDSWSQGLDIELGRASNVWNCPIQVVKLLCWEVEDASCTPRCWSRTEATPAGLASCVNTPLHTSVCEVNTHRHQAKSAGMTDQLHRTTRKSL